MNNISAILVKVLAREFYREHIFFFLIVCAIAFGFASYAEHRAIALFLTSAPLLTVIPVCLWAAYTARVVSFNTHASQKQENRFLYDLVFVAYRARMFNLIKASVLQLGPVLAYGGFMIVIALGNNQVFTAALLILSLAMLTIIATLALNHSLHRPHAELRVSRLQRYLNRAFITPQSLFFIGWTARHRALALLWAKAFSCAILFAVLTLYTTDTYDLRLLGLGILIAFAITVDTATSLHAFNNMHLALLRQLPFSQAQRVASFLITWVTLILPETGLLITRFPKGFDFIDFISAYGFALSIPFLFYNIQYIKDWPRENVMKIIYTLVIAWFVLILFKTPLALLAAANFAAGIALWKRFWYTFEYIARETAEPDTER